MIPNGSRQRRGCTVDTTPECTRHIEPEHGATPTTACIGGNGAVGQVKQSFLAPHLPITTFIFSIHICSLHAPRCEIVAPFAPRRKMALLRPPTWPNVAVMASSRPGGLRLVADMIFAQSSHRFGVRASRWHRIVPVQSEHTGLAAGETVGAHLALTDRDRASSTRIKSKA